MKNGELSLFNELTKIDISDYEKSKLPENAEQVPAELSLADDGDFEMIVDIVGADAAFKIAESFAGSSIYIPKNVLTNRVYIEIRGKFKKGSSYRELAFEYDFSETHIRNIIHKK